MGRPGCKLEDAQFTGNLKFRVTGTGIICACVSESPSPSPSRTRRMCQPERQ